ncbi:alpha/beta hydrolase family protein [Paraconexibacter algicola]|uniref:Alpha/beta hydrolase n=1 Tax=Paraconexibacter algicola TaxID=2133960 RepID=A0A2T4UE93_9ACTN|nr:hypothetical protein [Paraconexibacter algicola]PTL56118.1 hypothetical protein C7Y72_14080 [Paraconexibacter algicola]
MLLPRLPRRLAAALALAVLLVPVGAARAAPTCGRVACDMQVLDNPGGDRGVAMIVNSGGWFSGTIRAAQWRSAAAPWAAEGWTTVVVSHTTGPGTGRQAIDDVVAWAQTLRRRYPNRPLCVFGRSSGGHLALMAAARGDIGCVVTEGAPTALDALGGYARTRAASVFGARLSTLAAFSPAGLPGRYAGKRVLMGHLEDDRIVPASQMVRFRPSGTALLRKRTPAAGVRCGSAPSDAVERRFAHNCQAQPRRSPSELTGITDAALERWRGEIRALARRLDG